MKEELLSFESVYQGAHRVSLKTALIQLDDDLMRYRRAISKCLSPILKEYLFKVVLELKKLHSSKWSRERAGKSVTLMNRSGRSFRDVKTYVRYQEDGLQGYISLPGHLYFHEEGGWIQGRRGKGYLAIPLDGALYPSGVKKPGMTPKRFKKDTFLITAGDGAMILAKRMPGKPPRNILPLFYLTQRVYIPKRLRLHKIMEAELPYFGKLFGEELYLIRSRIKR